MRRRPLRSRTRWRTTDRAAANWLCRAPRSRPAAVPRASRRAGTSWCGVRVDRAAAPFVARVQRGEERHHLRAPHLAHHKAVRPHAQRLTYQVAQGHEPRPFLVGRPAPRAAPHADGPGRSSAESSASTTRSPGPTRPSNALRSVVFPDPVPPLIRKDSRASRRARSTRSPPGGTVPAVTSSSSVKARGRTTRSDRHAQPTATGRQDGVQPGTVRQPGVDPRPSRRPGAARPPPPAAARACARMSVRLGSATPVSSRPPPRSTHTRSGADTSTSVTEGSASRGSSGPVPTSSERN